MGVGVGFFRALVTFLLDFFFIFLLDKKGKLHIEKL